MVHKILHEAQGIGEGRYHVKWRDTIDLRKRLVMFEKVGYKKRVTHNELMKGVVASYTGTLDSGQLETQI